MFHRILAPVVNPILETLGLHAHANSRHSPGIRGRAGVEANPSGLSLLAGVAIAAAAIGGGYWLHKSMSGSILPKVVPPTPVEPDEFIASHIHLGATLGKAPDVVADIEGPILLARTANATFARAPELAINFGDGVREMSAVTFGAPKIKNGSSYDPLSISFVEEDGGASDVFTEGPSIGTLVTNTTGEFTQAAYEYALLYIDETINNWGTDAQQDETIKKILANVAPEINWTNGLQDYGAHTLAYMLWVATMTIGEVAYQSFVNKTHEATVQPEVGGVPLQPPEPDEPDDAFLPPWSPNRFT